VQPEPAPTVDRAEDPAQAAVAALGAILTQRGAVPHYERTGGGACMCGRICMCFGVYVMVSNVLRAHAVPVLTAVARVPGESDAVRGDVGIFGS
jgi:hypothetical protein